jgi:hypothetical protein
MRKIPILALALLLVGIVHAQQSSSYRLDEHTFNAGGHPHQGTVLSSATFRITLDAVGDAVAGRHLASASFRLDGSFGSCFAPVGEVHGLGFEDHENLVWGADPSAGHYNLYRDFLANLSRLGYGICEQPGLPAPTAHDPFAPVPGDGFFYLVTAANRLHEEGTKGEDSEGVPRPNPEPCP